MREGVLVLYTCNMWNQAYRLEREAIPTDFEETLRAVFDVEMYAKI